MRRGSSTDLATDEIFQKLIELRLAMVRELCKWLNKNVTVHGDTSTLPPPRKMPFDGGFESFIHRWDWENEAKLVVVNRFWITLEIEGKKKSEPLEKLILSYDDNNDRLKVIVRY